MVNEQTIRCPDDEIQTIGYCLDNFLSSNCYFEHHDKFKKSKCKACRKGSKVRREYSKGSLIREIPDRLDILYNLATRRRSDSNLPDCPIEVGIDQNFTDLDEIPEE